MAGINLCVIPMLYISACVLASSEVRGRSDVRSYCGFKRSVLTERRSNARSASHIQQETSQKVIYLSSYWCRYDCGRRPPMAFVCTCVKEVLSLVKNYLSVLWILPWVLHAC